MLKFLGLGKLQLIVAAAVLAAAAATIGILLWQNRSLSQDLAIETENRARAEQAVQTQRDATRAAVENADQWQQAFSDLQVTVQKMAAAQVAAAQEVRRLNEIFNDHDLTALAIGRPGLVQNRINSGSDAVVRVLHEITSGGGHSPAAAGDPTEGDPPAAAADSREQP